MLTNGHTHTHTTQHDELQYLLAEVITLGVVGVVGVLVADATNFEGPKVPNFIEKSPFLFASEQSRMSTLSIQKL